METLEELGTKGDRMTLPKKALLAAGILFTSLIGGLYIAASTILLHSLRQTEEQNARQAVAGVVSLFTQTQADFSSRVADWAAWDETYVFIKDANQDYVASNLIPETLAILKINLALYFQPSGRIVFGTGFDLIHQKKTAIPKAFQAPLSPQDILLQHSDSASSLTGIMLLPEGPMLISSRPIVTSDIKGPIRGTVIFGRFLDAEAIARLARISRLQLSVHELNETQLPDDFQAARSALSEQQPLLVHRLSEQTIAGYTLLKDIYNQPALLLRVDVPRETYKQGQNSLRYLMASLLLMGLVFGGLTLLLLKQLLLSQRQWQQSEARYRTLVTQASEGIFLVDIDTKQILEANAAFQKLLGYTSACGLTLYDVVAEERQSIDQDLLLILKAEDYFSGERQCRRQDGQLVDVEVNANLISHDGKDAFCFLVHDITERKQFQEQLLHNAFHDSLTGLANRALFMNRLQHVIQLAQRRALDQPYLFAVIFLDLDRFKVINDSLGHMVGDQLLIAIARRLRTCLRASDTFARLGGDEFAILLADNQSDTDVYVIVDRIQQAFKKSFSLEAVTPQKGLPAAPLLEIFATASIGLILNTKGYQHPEELLRDADIAMYRAKVRGRACYEVFDVTMHDHAVAQLQLENDLRRAIEKQEFQLYYQPIICLKTGGLRGFEALVRWQRRDNLVSPAEFIPIAEETGLIVPLGWWVLREACCQMRSWQRQFGSAVMLSLGGPLTISVNISSKQFLQPNLIEQIKQILQETELDARSLKLEITESTFMENADSATAMLLEMQRLGIRLAIDDFGTGYSSLSYLNRFPTDTLKIDRSFVMGMSSELESLEIVRIVVMLARNLGMDVVAEGVETSEQLAQLKALQCHNGQGYLFSKPLPSKGATTLLSERYCSLTY